MPQTPMPLGQWNSVTQVISEFELESEASDFEGILAELKSQRATVHPDKTGGAFPNTVVSDRYYRLDEAIVFVEQVAEQTKGLVPVSRMNEIVRATVEAALAPIRTSESASQQLQFLEDFRRQVRYAYTRPKVAAAIVGAVFGGLILLTNMLKDNVVFSPLGRAKWFIYLLWAALLVCEASFIVTWWREREEKNHADELTSDEGLRRAFSLSCGSLYHNHRGSADSPSVSFSKAEYTVSLIKEPYYSPIAHHLRGLIGIKRKNKEADDPYARFRPTRFDHLKGAIAALMRPLGSAPCLTASLAERLAELHLERLVARRAIRAASPIDLDQMYEIDRKSVERIWRSY